VTARTVYFAGVVIAQIGNAFACRTFSARNRQMGWGSYRALLASVIIALIILATLIYFPPLRLAFDNDVFPSIIWPFLFLYPLALYVLEWFRKRIFRRTEKYTPDTKNAKMS
jgi:uncharacterized membrane protein YbhN (UPF0104 family)